MNAMLDEPPPRLLDPDDLLSMPGDGTYELIDGVPVEKETGSESEIVAFDLATMLSNYVKAHRLGLTFGSKTGFSAFPGRPKLHRIPDAMFYSASRLTRREVPIGLLKIAPDLAVEVISPDNTAQEIDGKVELYRSAGVRLIWVLYPETRKAYVHRLDRTTTEVGFDGTLKGEDVVPGFECRIAELFED